MSGKIRVALAAMLICLLAVLPALAAGVFQFTDKSVSLREGESFQTTLRREGVFDGDGEITYTSSKPGIASVSDDGTITAVARGEQRSQVGYSPEGRKESNMTEHSSF